MPWNPDQYHKFQAERSAPFFDLRNLVKVRSGLKVVDLGCGTGELTCQLADALPGSTVTGLDQSPEMLEKAAQYASPALHFKLGDQSQLNGTWDLIFSNAALQWSEHHETLIPDLFSRLNPGGQIAVQVPSNHNHVSHQIIRQAAAEEPFRSALHGYSRDPTVLSIDQYAGLLFKCGAEEINVFEKVYPHILENADAVLEWIKGTALVPYLERIGPQKEAFLGAIREKLNAAMWEAPVFYPFRRTFISAFKG
jgi:trans-aconitate 2-methyltransferase